MATQNSINLRDSGIVSYDGAGTFAGRTLTAASSKISITGADGIAGNPTFDAVEANFTLNNIGGTLSPTKGGTGLTTYTTGDVLYASAANTLSKLSAGTTGQVLTMGASVPSWQSTATPPAGMTTNLAFSYASPTFTLHGADGSALGASNPAYVTIPSNTSSQNVTYQVTANITFQDDSGTSVLTGNTFGTTATTAWNVDMPFYLYAVAKDADADVTFMISRIPHATTSPAAANIGKSGSAVADEVYSFFAIDSGITVGDYDGNPCAVLGSFRMRKNDATNDDWTVQALGDVDGINRWNERFYTLPGDQNGATSSALSSSVGGDTIPTFQDYAAGYVLMRTGLVYYTWNFNNITVSGSGAGDLRFHLPIPNNTSETRLTGPGGWSHYSTGGPNWVTGQVRIDQNYATYGNVIASHAERKLWPGDLTTGSQNGGYTVTYIARYSS